MVCGWCTVRATIHVSRESGSGSGWSFRRPIVGESLLLRFRGLLSHWTGPSGLIPAYAGSSPGSLSAEASRRVCGRTNRGQTVALPRGRFATHASYTVASPVCWGWDSPPSAGFAPSPSPFLCRAPAGGTAGRPRCRRALRRQAFGCGLDAPRFEEVGAGPSRRGGPWFGLGSVGRRRAGRRGG